MSRIEVVGTDEAIGYLATVAARMTELLPVSYDEAVARLNRRWRTWELLTDTAVATLMHEEPDYWAKDIYFGHDSYWWTKDEAELTPLPYP